MLAAVLIFIAWVILLRTRLRGRLRTVYDAYRYRLLALSVSLLFTIGLAYGALCQWHRPTVTPLPLDTAVTARGTVLNAMAMRTGERYLLKIYELQRVADGRWKPVQFTTEWLVWHSNGRALQQGAKVVLSGTFELPPVSSRKGLPVRQELKAMGVDEEFQGHLISVVQGGPSLQDRLSTLISRGLTTMGVTSDENTLLQSIVFGHQGTAPSQQVHEAFLRSGLLHVLAASGANVFFMEWLFSRMLLPLKWLRRRLYYPQLLINMQFLSMLWLFCLICGFQASIVRATLLSSYRHVGRMAGRQPSMWNGLLFSALIMTTTSPNSLFTPSAALSFTATAAVQRAVLRGPRTKLRVVPEQSPWRHVQKWALFLLHKAVVSVRVTVVVEAYLLPLVVFWFGQLTPLSIVANFLAEPVLILLLPTAAIVMMAAALHVLLPWLVPEFLWRTLLWTTLALLRMLLSITQWLAQFPQALYHTQPISIVDISSYYLSLIGVPALAQRLRRAKNL